MSPTKHEATPSNAMVPQDAVLPRLHPTQGIIDGVASGDMRHEAILQSLAYLAVEKDWRGVWQIADALSREISILVDATGLLWVDVGDPGMVHLAPPMGCTLPLRLWVHTHPVDAYWSSTDKRTLATVRGILEEALVLGDDHCVRALPREAPPESSYDARLGESGPLLHWTAEAARPYV